MSARLYVYAIVPAGLAVPTDLVGLRDAPVAHVSTGALSAWGSRLEPFQANRDDLLAYHRVVEAACALGPALPVRFGATFASAAALVQVLQRRATEFSAALARVGRKREVAITLEWRPSDGAHAAAPPAPAVPAPPQHLGRGPGRAYLERRARKWADAERQRTRAEQLADQIQRQCLPDGAPEAELRLRFVPSPRVALSCAVLTDPAQAEEVMRCVREAAAAWEDVRLHLAGPWPPYSFSDAEYADR